ncbi:MAG: antirestriction protein [Salinisphaera sp.]|jgi:hypothetical protein|nr:antirestriction protein [Salinisphaera sp.]
MNHAIDDDSVTGQSILTTATAVPEDQRMHFLPRFFGHDMRVGETLVFNWMQELAADYDGGYWTFYELSNGGFYMAPELDCETIRIRCSGNFYNGQMSPDAAGIVATLYALNALVWKTRRSRHKDMFDRLRDYAGDHAEGPAIFAAID